MADDPPEEADVPPDPPAAPAASALVAGVAVRLRKPHACGGLQWTVTRTGADVGLQCQTCGRRILLPRDEFLRRVRISPVP